MSVDYAAGLSHYDDLGVCGLDEVFDKPEDLGEKVRKLADLLRQHRGSCVVHVGAGLSTAAGIPDFRGKRGVWTERLRRQHESISSSATNQASEVKTEAVEMIPFDHTEPTLGHLALKSLCDQGFVRHIISQNVDGLFLKSNIDREYISELHGNFYLDECTKCRWRYIRATASSTMRLQKSDIKCPRSELSDCRGHLRDTILDWESPIPYNELRVATKESKRNKLHICIGTSMQLRPSKDLVCNPKRDSSMKLVIINLQPTMLDERANLVIHYYADNVLKDLMEHLQLEVESYSSSLDPTKNPHRIGEPWIKSRRVVNVDRQTLLS